MKVRPEVGTLIAPIALIALSMAAAAAATMFGADEEFRRIVIGAEQYDEPPHKSLHSTSSIDVPDFEVDVMPILGKYGCNSAACHGAAAGQGGFRLSLFCGDPDSDYDQVVRDRQGRRIHRTRAAESLLLLKACQSINHGGGERFDETSEAYQILRRWIAGGAPRGGTWSVERFKVSREANEGLSSHLPRRLIAMVEMRHKVTGEVELRLMTPWTTFESLDESMLELADGTVRALRPGRGFVLARWANRTALLAVDTPWAERLEESAWPAFNEIDRHINSSLAAMGVQPLKPAPTTTQLRRLYLDLTGRLPPATLARKFHDKAMELDEYEKLVDELLSSPQFVEKWTFHVTQWLRVAARSGSDDLTPYLNWIRRCVEEDRSLTDMMRETILAQGSSTDQPAVGFYHAVSNPGLQAERTSEIWMGVQLRCANCHNHPLDRWTRADYHGMAAVFAHLDFGNPLRLIEQTTLIDGETGRTIAARLPNGTLAQSPDPRVDLANWLAQEDNFHVSRVFANRIWMQLMGRGLYEPPDDWRETNPVRHPELLALLAGRLQEHGNRIRPLIREIVMSAAYRRAASAEFDERQEWFYAFRPRRIPAEVLAVVWRDLLGPVLTESNSMRSVRRLDREQRMPMDGCDRMRECGVMDGRVELELDQALDWINGDTLNQLLADERGWLAEQWKAAIPDREFVESVYWRALARPAHEDELNQWIRLFQTAAAEDERFAAWQDFLWSMVTCNEFIMVW